MKNQIYFVDRTLPLLVEPGEEHESSLPSLLEWLERDRVWFNAQLLKFGAVLLRGFEVESDEDFELVCRMISSELKQYVEGNSPRSHVSQFVYTSTNYPQEFDISMHNELSYTNCPPRFIFFGCLAPAPGGGETPIIDCRKALEYLDPDVVSRFEGRSVMYVQKLHGGAGLGRSWQETYETDRREDVERHLFQAGVTAKWLDDGSLRTEQVRPAVKIHEITKERVWFNQADQWHPSNLDPATRRALAGTVNEADYPLNVFFGDGSRIPEEDLEHIRRVMWKHAVRFPWKRGDVLTLDNCLVAHGRTAYTGYRAVRVAMA